MCFGARAPAPDERGVLLARLDRVHAMLAAWQTWDENAHLPPGLQREVVRPPLSPAALEAIALQVLIDLAQLPAQDPRR